jgi:2-methylcitrate dehydratase PrpD
MYGYYKLFEPESDIATWWAQLGTVWQVSRISHKPFPSGRLTHAAIDAVQRARTERDFGPDEVAEVRGWMPPLAHRLVGRPDIPNPAVNYAKLCTAFVTATEIAHREVIPESFAPERLADPQLHALAARVTVEQSDHPDPNALWPQRFVIKLKDGWTWDRTIDKAIGHPDNPLSRAAHLAKFRRCWRYGRPEADPAVAERLIEMVDALDRLDDVRALAAPLA